MPNSIKSTGADAVALQITREARDASLVEEADDDAARLAPVNVYPVDGLLLVIDRDRVDQRDVAELVTAAARDTESIYPGGSVRVTTRGEGYQVPLPGAIDAGFNVDDAAPCATAPGLLLIHREGDGRLARHLKTIRQEQVA
jgi:hypothetical protein